MEHNTPLMMMSLALTTTMMRIQAEEQSISMMTWSQMREFCLMQFFTN